MYQWGVNLPGACDALGHWIADGTLQPVMVADLDLVNMFGNVEWPSIRKALQRYFPEACAWTDWQHQEDSVTQAPAGLSWGTNRGAEQGDVFGTALILGTARAEGLTDGQALVRPCLCVAHCAGAEP